MVQHSYYSRYEHVKGCNETKSGDGQKRCLICMDHPKTACKQKVGLKSRKWRISANNIPPGRDRDRFSHKTAKKGTLVRKKLFLGVSGDSFSH